MVCSPLHYRRSFQERLRRWYQHNARDLPWRNTPDPYHIWVSEVMLQQTQVSTVVPYFCRFLTQFPTVESLASAPQEDVLKQWQGLGYYRRALNLHQAAKDLVARFDGRVPNDFASLRQFPGVGRYIAGAILSFAFDVPTPILEANSARVLSRLFAIRQPLNKGPTQNQLWKLSEALLPHRYAGLHNQALMELGALVCVPGRPRCEHCPVANLCMARALGVANELPSSAPRRKFVDIHDAAVILRRRGRVLIVQRMLEERWGGLWELPRATVAVGEDPCESLRVHVKTSLGLDIKVGRKLLIVKHGVTHHRITLSCYETKSVSGRAHPKGYANCRWELLEKLGDFAYSSPQRKLIAAVQGMGRETSDG